MKIANINIQPNATRSNNSTEPKGDEFTQLLNKIVSDGEEPSDKDIILSEEPTEKDADNLLDPMLILSNLMMSSSIDTKQYDINSKAFSEEEVAITMDVERDVVKVDTSNLTGHELTLEDFTEKNKFIEFDSNTSLEEESMSLKLDTFSVDEHVKNENIKDDDSTVKEKHFSEAPVSGKKEDFHDERALMRLKDIPKDISSLSESEEKNIEIEPNKATQTKEVKVNLTDSIVKEQNKIPIEFKADSPKEIMPNDNIQKIQDTLVHLMETTTEGKASVVKVKLYPEDLGTVDVTLRMEEGKLTAKILVDSEHIKGLFNGKINELNESLVKQNIHIEKISVDLNNVSEKFNFDFNHNGSFNQGRRNAFKKSNYRAFRSEKIVSQSNETSSLGSGAISILA